MEKKILEGGQSCWSCLRTIPVRRTGLCWGLVELELDKKLRGLKRSEPAAGTTLYMSCWRLGSIAGAIVGTANVVIGTLMANGTGGDRESDRFFVNTLVCG